MKNKQSNPIRVLVKSFSGRARKVRAEIFRQQFLIDENTKILDLGSETGSNIKFVLDGTRAQASNIYIADIDSFAVEKGRENFGFIPVVISESEGLPFPDGYFDIVYCSSVIEHVTIPKNSVWTTYSGAEFKKKSLERQTAFANEIRRLGKQYFVQTPYRHFPVESHSWLPFVAWLPRWLLILTLRITNTFWVKNTSPDWYLLNKRELSALFPEARIAEENKWGMTKSIMAINVTSSN